MCLMTYAVRLGVSARSLFAKGGQCPPLVSPATSAFSIGRFVVRAPHSFNQCLALALFGLLGLLPTSVYAFTAAELEATWSVHALTFSEDQLTGDSSLRGTISVDATGNVIGGALDGTTSLVTGGHLSIDSNGSIVGSVDVDNTALAMRALMIPNTQAIVGVGTSGQIPKRKFSYLVLVRQDVASFAQGDLGDTWNMFALSKSLGGSGAWAQGTLSVDFNGAVLAGQIKRPTSTLADTVSTGMLTLTPAGAVSGTFVWGATTTTVAGVMLPDKNLIVGVLTSSAGISFFYLERQSSESFSQAALDGTWYFHDLSGFDKLPIGVWLKGTFNIGASGHLSGSLGGPDGASPLSGGPVEVVSGGLVTGALVQSDGSSLDLSAVMLPSKDMIVGVNSIEDPSLPGVLSYGVFSLVKALATVQLSASSYSVSERAGGATITVTRSGSTTSTVTLDYATSDGTAVAGRDYTAVSETLTFGPGVMSRTFVVPVINNTIVDGTRTVNLTLSAPGGGAQLGPRASAVLNILDEDLGGQVQFSAAAYSVKENAGTATITVTRSGGSASAVTVSYATGDGSAIAGTDYTATSGTLTFDAGVMSRTFTVPIADNPIADGNRSLSLTLSTPGGGAKLGTLIKATLSIVDDERGLRFSVATYNVKENAGSATITVTRTGPSSGALSVKYATSHGSATTGVDYKEVSGTLTFASGVMSRTFIVPLINNTIVDGNRTVNIALSDPGGGALLGTPNAAVLTILDDDLGGQIQFSAVGYNVKENAGKVTITVTRAGGTDVLDKAWCICQVLRLAVAQCQAGKDASHFQVALQAHPLHTAVKITKILSHR